MLEAFDPYHKWLGIPPEEQPAHHYRLLAIKLFEDDAEVIQHAADRQMSHLRTFQAGRHGPLSQRLLNEVAAARVCLLNPPKKAAYDSQLRRLIEAAAQGEDTSSHEQFLRELGEIVAEKGRPSPPHRPKQRLPHAGLLGAVAGLLGLGALVLVWLNISHHQSQPVVALAPKFVSQPTPPPKPLEPATKPPIKGPLVPVVAAEKPAPSHQQAKTKPENAEPSPPLARPQPSAPRPQPAPATPPARDPAPLALSSPSTAASVPGPVPDQASQDRSLKVAQDIFRADYERAKTSAQKAALARKLLEQSTSPENNSTERFVLLRLARDVAVQADNMAIAFDAIQRMAEGFQVDSLRIKADVLTGLVKAAKGQSGHKAMAERVIELAGEALAQDQHDLAAELAKLAHSEAGKARDKETVLKTRTIAKEVQDAQKTFAEVGTAIETLKQAPNDPAANLVAGRYYGLVKGDWEKGLPLLAKGSDSALSVAAALDLQNPTEAEKQAAIGDAWWDRASNEEPRAKRRLQLRAAHWYWTALPNLDGLAKAKVEKRAAALKPLVAALPVPKQFVNKIDQSTLVLVPGGEFLAGPEKIPVQLPGYYLGLCEITNAQFQKFADATGYARRNFSADKVDHPVLTHWDGAAAYCRWAGLRLPTELEWEKGARGVDGRTYPWGDTWDPTKCSNRSNSNGTTCPVLSFPEGRSPWGICQMIGNAWEWCDDLFDPEAYRKFKQGIFAGLRSGDTRVVRGACFSNDRPEHMTCVYRGGYDQHKAAVGFRVAKSVIP